MKTIVPAKQNAARLWGHPKPKDGAYRPIKYLLKVQVEDGTLLHNTVTGQTVLLSMEEANEFNKLPNEYTPELNELIADHFAVAEEFDERRSVLQLKSILRRVEDSKAKNITGYTILPTTLCNARCFYCYEANAKHIQMSAETAQQAVKFIKQNCGGQKVSIGWFGGEPTVAAERIDQICKELTEEGVEYSANMISNGYLLDAKMADRAKSLWKLKNIQITLDGTEEVYNRVKAYSAAVGSPYRTVLANISGLLEREIDVSIRMNLDRHNAEDLKTLIGELAERYSGNAHFSAYVWPLFDDCGFAPVEHTAEDRRWLFERETELNELLQQKGIYRKKVTAVPSIKIETCMADNDKSIIINADGSLAKCEHTFMTETVGSIREGITDNELITEWKQSAEYPECAQCPLYPSCRKLRKCFSACGYDEDRCAADIKNAEKAVYDNYKK